jgi:hypothetical protein
MAIGFALFTIDLFLHRAFGRRRVRNPWGAGTLEWAMPIPPPAYNFAAIPEVRGREPVADTPSLPLDLVRGSGYLAFVRDGRMETLGVELTSGRLEQIVRLPRQTFPTKPSSSTSRMCTASCPTARIRPRNTKPRVKSSSRSAWPDLAFAVWNPTPPKNLAESALSKEPAGSSTPRTAAAGTAGGGVR